jgi:alpha-glucosidase
MDRYPGTANVGEVWVAAPEQFAKYVRPDELHLGFNFSLAETGFVPSEIRAAIDESLAATELAGATRRGRCPTTTSRAR